MSDDVNPTAELAGSFSKSINDAIQNAVICVGETLRNLDRFEIIERRCQIRDGEVAYYEVGLNIAVSSCATDRRRRGPGAHRLAGKCFCLSQP